jgi:hypothetical protein
MKRKEEPHGPSGPSVPSGPPTVNLQDYRIVAFASIQQVRDNYKFEKYEGKEGRKDKEVNDMPDGGPYTCQEEVLMRTAEREKLGFPPTNIVRFPPNDDELYQHKRFCPLQRCFVTNGYQCVLFVHFNCFSIVYSFLMCLVHRGKGSSGECSVGYMPVSVRLFSINF